LNKTPKYGNDDDYADDIMKLVFDAFYEEVNGRKIPKAEFTGLICSPQPVIFILVQ
jgi:Pyruvate formate lyase.